MEIIELSKNYNKKSYKSKGSWHINVYNNRIHKYSQNKKLLIVLQKKISKKFVDTK